jgi:hypothetical protein
MDWLFSEVINEYIFCQKQIEIYKQDVLLNTKMDTNLFKICGSIYFYFHKHASIIFLNSVYKNEFLGTKKSWCLNFNIKKKYQDHE